MPDDVAFFRDGLRFERYPFRVASVAREPWLPASAIAEVRLRRYPPEVVRHGGEVLFVPRADLLHLDLFARLNDVPRVERLDVWGWLNEPFLDTESDAASEQRVLDLLLASGFDAAEVAAIRARVGPTMLRYNAVVWEWVHLGHQDLLRAWENARFLPRSRASQVRDYEAFAAIANRGAPTAAVERDPAEALAAEVDELVSELVPQPAMRGTAADTWVELGPAIERRRALRERLLHAVAPYASPDRSHHDTAHVLQVVQLCRALRAHVVAAELPVLVVAALFHDVVYDARAGDNEERSAAAMRATLGDVLAEPQLALAERLILVTKNHARAATDAERVLADADLYILAEEPARYRRYADGIRAEYAHVDAAAFIAGRLAFVRGMQRAIEARGRLYHFLHPMHEAQARANLDAERARLEAGGAPA